LDFDFRTMIDVNVNEEDAVLCCLSNL